ncbi:MAG TPA: hypothetical protein VHR45_22880 [Thermoanaerobaculia bacterium]|nr:hypothetical protein [Thermoanaerobaculia bacterium]
MRSTWGASSFRLRVYLLSWAVAGVVAVVALTARFGPADAEGARFAPRPEALEAAATAQSIVQAGKLRLQVGPYRLRPPQPPGWALILAGALRVGVPPRELWHVTGFCGGILAVLLAVAVTRSVRALRGPPPRGQWPTMAGAMAGAMAGLFAGSLFALAPVAIRLDRTLLSDEAVACLAGAALLLGVRLLGPFRAIDWPAEQHATRRRAVAVGCGIVLGALASVEPVEALLLAPPLAILVAGCKETRTAARAALPWAALGLLVFPLLAGALLVRSGAPAWRWSSYDRWSAERYGKLAAAFSPGFAAALPHEVPPAVHGEAWSRLGFIASSHLELSGGGKDHKVGPLWSGLCWISLAGLVIFGWQGRAKIAVPWRRLPLAVLVWVAGDLAASYFFPHSRLHLAAAAAGLWALGTAAGLGFGQQKWTVRGVAIVGVCLMMVTAAAGSWRQLEEPAPAGFDPGATERAVTAWLRLSDEERSERQLQFDPLEAQALGLLRPDVLARVQRWGADPERLRW